VGRVVVVALKHVAERADEHVVRIAHVLSGGLESGAVGIDAQAHAALVKVAVRTRFVHALGKAVVAAGDDVAFVLGLHVGAAVAERKMPLPARRADDGVQ